MINKNIVTYVINHNADLVFIPDIILIAQGDEFATTHKLIAFSKFLV